jgi:hypothetical protein
MDLGTHKHKAFFLVFFFFWVKHLYKQEVHTNNMCTINMIWAQSSTMDEVTLEEFLKLSEAPPLYKLQHWGLRL